MIGGRGWTGSVLVPLLAERGFRVEAPPRSVLDLQSAPTVLAYLAASRPLAVVNVAAATPQASDEELHAVNVLGAEAVARGAHACRARLVHVSSDAGLDGRHAPYTDDAPMDPVYAYGRSKAEGEARVLAACPTAVAVRTSLLWDPATVDRGTAGFAARLEAGASLDLFTDEIRCPLPRAELAACLADLIDVPYAGTLNVAGREALSRRDFGLLLLERFGVPGIDRVGSVRRADLEAAGAAPRPRDLRLDVSRAEALLGRPLPGVRDVLGLQSDTPPDR